MARLRRRKIGKKHYYYLEHSYKLGKKVKVLSKYLGAKKPARYGMMKSILSDFLLKSILAQTKSI